MNASSDDSTADQNMKHALTAILVMNEQCVLPRKSFVEKDDCKSARLLLERPFFDMVIF